jgi:RND family efflux transporter MFP subunit
MKIRSASGGLLPVILLALFAGGGLPISCSHEGRHAHAAKSDTVIYQCPMHPRIISDHPGACPICGMALVQVKNAAAGASTGEAASPQNAVRIDPSVVRNMGVTTAPVTRRALSRTVRAGGVVDLDETKVSIVSARVAGYVDKLHIDFPGRRVQAGQPLLDIYSPDLVSTQEEYIRALNFRSDLPSGAPIAAMAQADSLIQSARRRLVNWDIPDRYISSLDKNSAARKALTIHSPADGVVLEKMVAAGQNVMPGMVMYKIADLSIVWVQAAVAEADIPFVKHGAKAVVGLASAPGTTYPGTVGFIAPVLDPATRTVQTRVEVRNTPDLALKPGMVASVEIAGPSADSVPAVPEQALIRTGTRILAIVALGNGAFQPREVVAGVSADGWTQIVIGLTPGESIVTSAQFLIDSESNLRAAIEEMKKGR